MSCVAYRASIIHSIADPVKVGLENSYEYFEDGVLVVKEGKILDIGNAEDVIHRISGSYVYVSLTGKLITAGFVDTHIHFPQTEMIGAYGEQLLDWLNNYTFPEESKFGDKKHATRVAKMFLTELLRNGTTTAMVFGSVHKDAVEAFFEESNRLNTRMIAGKVMMDRNAPEQLLDTAEQSYIDSKELIDKWHGKGRQLYAVTPRFAPTSTEEQLTAASKLLEEYTDKGVYMQTHISENKKEIEWVKALFPQRNGYLDVYDYYKLLTKRSMFAHAIHLTDNECDRLAETGSAVSFCPTSNLFLGSGLFNMARMEDKGVSVSMGTDIGAGTSFSMLATLREAYKVCQLQGQKLHCFKSLYLATLGGATALRLEDKIGNLAKGKEADFVVLDFESTPIMAACTANAKNIAEKLFILMTIGDDRAVYETYVAGQSVHHRIVTAMAA